ncbi:MAG TPA: ATP-grasp domain-containing protein [Planctomycetaceae bacterium]|jgi:predicted ATP-grasp superfamily ATP-dependent carboligase|nr:ATP-grasp domain-containing protein [Planctomycetaceae bacterium]
MRTLLLTAGRGTYALTLARRFHSEGYRVLVADAWPHTLCRYSSAVARYFHVPSPARETSAWLDAVWDIAEKHGVDLIIPIYEEVFYLAQAKAARKSGPPLFAPNFETLISLHDKWLFIQKVRELGLSAPDTTRIESRDELMRVFAEREGSRTVYKPVYSRFAAQIVVRPQGVEALDGVEPTLRRPWIAQEYLPGRPFATFSVAHRGRITAHATYATDFCHSFGPTVVYRRVEQPTILQWVRTFIEAIEYTGQVGLDFIEDAAGRIAAIECNPRLTGGMYLLKDDPRFTAAYFDPQIGPIEATRARSYAFRFWLFCTLFQHTKSFPGFGEWSRQFFGARSTNEFLWSDPLPRLMGPVLTAGVAVAGLKRGIGARAMVTRDFEWSEDLTALNAEVLARWAAEQAA